MYNDSLASLRERVAALEASADNLPSVSTELRIGRRAPIGWSEVLDWIEAAHKEATDELAEAEKAATWQ